MASATAAQPVAGMAAGNPQLMSLLERYFPSGNEYGAELKTAREVNSREQEAFQNMLQSAMKTPAESGPSKAEMYFRLAAAFGAPTKTGSFVESLGTAGGAASEMLKEQRTAATEARARNLALGLEAQKLRMSGAKEDLTTLRQLAAEGMKDKRTVATELIKDYVNSGKPQSTAGKQAVDEGFPPGTAEFKNRVSELANLGVESKMSQITALLAGMSTQQTAALLNQQRFQFQQEEARRLARILTAPELELKTKTEDSLGTLKGSMGVLKRAFDLNKNSMGGSLIDKGTRLALEAAGSKDPTLLNTQELENLLTDQMISSASEKMKGILSDSDIKLLSMVSGANSKNQEERKRIMVNAYGALQRGLEKQQKRLNEITQGLYRGTSPPAGGLK
jgi:hypothetical protein